MRSYLVDGNGIESIKISERPAPTEISDHEVLVDVKACSLNYRDLLVAKGQYSPGSFPPFIALSDMAGIVHSVGSKVQDLKPGDKVLNAPFRHWPAGILKSGWARTFIGGMGIDGVLSEQLLYPEDALVKIPQHLTFAEASTLTIAGLTAWASVITHGKTRPGDWVLLQGTGGVSLFAAQIAHAAGAQTILMSSSEEKAKKVQQLCGITSTLNDRDPNWPKKINEITQGKGVDVVVDVVGGEMLARSLQVCNYGARVAVVGVLSGQYSTIRMIDLIQHQISMKGIFMESTQELRAFVKAVEALKLQPIVDKEFSFAQAVEAYQYLESQKHIGKVVITL